MAAAMTDSLPEGYSLVGRPDSASPPPTQSTVKRPTGAAAVAPPDGYSIVRPSAAAAPSDVQKPPTSTIGNLARQAKGEAVTGLGQTLGGFADIGGKIAAALPEPGDFARSVAASPASASVARAGQGVRNVAGDITASGQKTAESVSPEFKAATSKGLLDEGGLTPTNIASKAVGTVASMAAPLVASAINPAVGVAAFGGQGTRQGTEEGRAQVEAMTPEQLGTVPRYNELVQSGIDAERAKAVLADEVANRRGTVSGLFGAGLGLAGKVPGVEALAEKVGSSIVRPIARAVGSTVARPVARTIGAGAGEAAGFSGINTAGQVTSNVTNQIPTSPSEGVPEAIASGLAPGFVLGAGRHGAHEISVRRPVPNPGAAAGSMSDAANAIHESGGTVMMNQPIQPEQASVTRPRQQPATEPVSAPPAAPPASAEPTLTDVARAETGAPSAAQRQPPSVPWIDQNTGEHRQPTDDEVKDQFHRMLQQASNEKLGMGVTAASRSLADEWGVPRQRLIDLRKQAITERKDGITPETRAQQQPQTEEPTNATNTGIEQASVPAQRENGDIGGQAAETGGSDRVQREAQNQPAEQPAETQETVTDLAKSLSHTDRATGTDGAKYIVSKNADGEGYHFTRTEQDNVTQHHSHHDEPWTREEAVRVASIMSSERAKPQEKTGEKPQDNVDTKPETGDVDAAAVQRVAEDGSKASAPVKSGEPSAQVPKEPTADNVARAAPDENAAPPARGAADADVPGAQVEQSGAPATPSAAEPASGVRSDSAAVKTSVGDVTINRDHDVPLLGGSNGKGTVYLDRSFDPMKPIGPKGEKVDVTPFLAEHEAVEAKAEREGKNYTDAHALATAAEHAKLKEAGIKPADYEAALKGDIAAAGKKAGPQAPADIIKKPYEHPHSELQRKMLGEVEKSAQPATVDAAAKESAAHPENARPEPTPAQHEAGNFKMGHVDLHGLDVTIEVPKGGLRRGTDKTGKEWQREASDHYGYIKRTQGADGEQVDVYLGPHAHDAAKPVFVIDQVKPGTSKFDEHKVMLGYATGREARASYDKNFPKGLKVFGGIRKMSVGGPV